MAITRGQMQRQLRKGGGIMDVASGTIGGGNYAGIPMGSRTGFGILKKIKRGVRKIIPNEVAKVATVAAPFVAPFNPALAGAMAGIGSFDQTGSLSDAFKRGALTYGGGQLVRGIGGAGFQGNPFVSGGAFTPSGFTAGFSSPLGTDTGLKLGRFFEKPSDVSGISGLDEGALQKTVDKAALENLSPEKRIAEEAATTFIENQAKANVAPKSVIQAIKNQDYFEAAKLAAEKGTKALFTTPITDAQGNVTGSKLDKTMLLAAGTAGLTYLDAKKLADEIGEDIGTEEEYDEATKAEKKAEYAGYLTNFFEGKKDGGRIGFKEGSDNPFFNLIEKISPLFVDEDGDYRSGLQKAKFALSDFIAGKGYDYITGAEWYNKLDDDTQMEILLMKQKIRDNPEAYSFSPRMKELTEQPVYDEEFAGKFGIGSRYAKGGRIGLELGGGLGPSSGLAAIPREMQRRKGGSSDLDLMTIKATLNQVYTNNDDGERGGYEAVMEFMENNPEYKVQIMENIIGDRGDKIRVAPIEETPINILDQDGMKTIMVGDGIELIIPKNKAKGGRIGLKGGSDFGDRELKNLRAVEAMKDRFSFGLDDLEDEGFERDPDTVLVMVEGPDGIKLKEVLKSEALRNNLKIVSDTGEFPEGRKAGGRIGYMFGDKVEDNEGIMSMSEDEKDENMKMAYFPGDVFSKSEISRLFRDKSLTTNQDRKQLFRILMNPGMFPEAEEMLKKLLRNKKDGGRIGFRSGSNRMMETFRMLEKAIADNNMDLAEELRTILRNEFSQKLAKGGRIKYNMGSEVPVRRNKAGIEELDYRQTGGFVPVGVKEKADDVPAMLSKNEFVLTADAVRGIGGGDVEKGAEKLYGVMKQAEKVGRA